MPCTHIGNHVYCSSGSPRISQLLSFLPLSCPIHYCTTPRVIGTSLRCSAWESGFVLSPTPTSILHHGHRQVRPFSSSLPISYSRSKEAAKASTTSDLDAEPSKEHEGVEEASTEGVVTLSPGCFLPFCVMGFMEFLCGTYTSFSTLWRREWSRLQWLRALG